jgi:hypothetical protein
MHAAGSNNKPDTHQVAALDEVLLHQSHLLWQAVQAKVASAAARHVSTRRTGKHQGMWAMQHSQCHADAHLNAALQDVGFAIQCSCTSL